MKCTFIYISPNTTYFSANLVNNLGTHTCILLPIRPCRKKLFQECNRTESFRAVLESNDHVAYYSKTDKSFLVCKII